MDLAQTGDMVQSDPVEEHTPLLSSMVKLLPLQSRQELSVAERDRLGSPRAARGQHENGRLLRRFDFPCHGEDGG